MAYAVGLQGQKSLGEQQHFQPGAKGRVSADDGLQVAPGRLGQCRELLVNAGEAIKQDRLLLLAVS